MSFLLTVLGAIASFYFFGFVVLVIVGTIRTVILEVVSGYRSLRATVVRIADRVFKPVL